MATRLDIGCGDTPREGFTGIDRKLGTEAYPLSDYADGSVDEVYASHVLEHFPHADAQDVLNEWVRVLRPGGKLSVAVPDWDRIVEAYQHGCNFSLEQVVYGGHVDENDVHHSMYNASGLRIMMRRAGIVGVRRFDGHGDCSSHPVSLNLCGVKGRKAAEVLQERRACVVMTKPRLTFSDNETCLMRISRLNVSYMSHSGAFWEKNISKVIDQAVEAGHEWIVTSDYDTVWDDDTLDALVAIFDANPDIDALAPLQMKRGGDYAFLKSSETSEEAYNSDSVPVEWAHFGLTLFRASAFAKLERPWTRAFAGEDGKWGSDSVDPDIGFWRNWRDVGNTVHVAPRIPVGHMELMVGWPDEDLRPHYQHVGDWTEHGKPKEARS